MRLKRENMDNGSDGRKVTWVGMFVNAGLIVLKFLAGTIGHSQGMIADAFHSVSDLLTDAVVLIGLRFGRKGPDAGHHFGHARIETMTSGIVGAALFGAALMIGYQSVVATYRHEPHNPTLPAILGAFVSIVVKELLYRYTVRVGKRIKSPAVVANAWHHRSDAMSSVAVLIGTTGAMVHPAWHLLDAYAALFVSLLIAKVGLEIIWQAFREMADTAPPPETVERIYMCIRGVEGVLDAHGLKARFVGGVLQVQVHILVDGGMTVEKGHQITREVEGCLKDDFDDMGEIIVHVEPESAGTDEL